LIGAWQNDWVMKQDNSDFVTIQGENGCWSLRVAGNGRRGTVIALHGFARDSGYFSGMVRVLEQDFTVIAPDLPFHGNTAWEAGHFTREDVLALFGQLCLLPAFKPPIYLLGHSMGARILLSVLPELPFEAVQVIALAPDGLASRGKFFSEGIPLGLRVRCKNILMEPRLLLRVSSFLHSAGILPAFQHRYLQRQLGDGESSRRLYHTWLSLYHFRVCPGELNQYRALKNLLYVWVLGSLDKIVLQKSAIRYLRKHKLDAGSVLHLVQDGHELRNLDWPDLFE
jgi:pimeloyl-ACP methyl ester carboxylesterase